MKKLALLFALACAAPAWAQYGEIWFSGGQSLFKNNGLGTLASIGGTKNDVKLGDGFRFGFRVAFNGDSLYGHEIQYTYSRTQLQIAGQADQGMAVHGGGYNFLMYANHEGTRIRPFATGGLNFANYVPPGASAYSGGGDNKFGFNYGGGVKVRVTGPWALRFDFRQYTTPKPFDLPLKSGWIRINELSGGVGFVF
jgi:opacity protein-like surface antigen